VRYLGGKSRLGKQIAYAINSIREPGQAYWEPFCGSCWVMMHVRGGIRYASDGHYELIKMWQALQDGWIPPSTVTEQEYQAAKSGEGEPHLRGFIGFWCSFGGKWFAGYARDPQSDRSYSLNTKRSLLARIGKLRDVSFWFCDYSMPDLGDTLLIYADPPYVGTESYHGLPFPFDTVYFWQVVRRWVNKGHAVIVSEYQAPTDFVCVQEFETHTDLEIAGGGKENRTERLFMHESQAHLFNERVIIQKRLL
jgi:DNA adenine methylase